MVMVRIAGVALDQTGQHVLLLKPIDDLPGVGRVLPIWIGELEATSILIAVQGSDVPRPLAHDLMRSLLESAGARVQRVEIARLDEGTYFAEVTLALADGIRTVDARPSDAVALAARAGAELRVADAVMEEAGVPDMTGDDEDAQERIEEFTRFLDEVDPDDFRG